LSSNHLSCPMLQEKMQGSLPSQLRAPLDKSELVQYFKNWIRAKMGA
jgi:hypothetical protein